MAINRKAFIAKHGRDAWDAKQWVDRYSAMGSNRTKGKSGDVVTSKGTRRQYIDVMKNVARELRHDKTTLERCTPEQFTRVLERLSNDLQQTQLNNTRIAGEKGFRCRDKYADVKIPMVKTELPPRVLESRAYSNDALKAIHDTLSNRHRLSLEITAVTGLRAHELLTLKPASERPPSARNWTQLYPDRAGWIPYTVDGKGGLHTLKMLPPALAEKLEAQRVPEHIVRDRRIEYRPVYNLVGGNALSKAFSRASNKVLGFSRGIHGCRHSYAQRRMSELPKLGYTRDQALLCVSQEMGHLRPEITEVYLR